MGKDTIKCQCGCGTDATYLCTGCEFDPSKPDSKGKQFVDEPCCVNASLYLEEGALQFNFPFSKKKI